MQYRLYRIKNDHPDGAARILSKMGEVSEVNIRCYSFIVEVEAEKMNQIFPLETGDIIVSEDSTVNKVTSVGFAPLDEKYKNIILRK